MCLDITRDDLARLGIHGNGARYKYKSVRLDCLTVDAREGLGGLVGDDGGLFSHGGGGRERVVLWVGDRKLGWRYSVDG